MSGRPQPDRVGDRLHAADDAAASPSKAHLPWRSALARINDTIRPYRGQVVISCLLFGLYTFFESVVLASFVPLFDLLTRDVLGASEVSLQFSRVFEWLGLPYGFGPVFFVVLGLTLARTGFKVLNDYCIYKALARYETGTKQQLFERLMKVRWPFFVTQKLGHLLSTQSTDVSRSRDVIRNVFLLANLLVAVLCYTVVAGWVSPAVTASALLFVAVLSLVFIPIFEAIKRSGASSVEAHRGISQQFSEFLLGFKVVKGAAIEARVVARMELLTSRLRRIMVYQGMLKGLIMALVEPFAIVFVIGYVYVINVFWGVSLAEASVVGLLIYRMAIRFTGMQGAISSLFQTVPSLDSVSQLLADAEGAFERQGGLPVDKFERLELRGLDFAYQEGRGVLSGLDLELSRGSFTGIVGSSGSGKTTLVDIILALLEPTEGRVLLNGSDLGSFDISSWRRKVGYVSQDTILFNASVLDNIRLFNDAISSEQVQEAARIANAHEFILELAHGYDTPIGDRGLRISGGQRQRISLARALVTKPDVLILDEATSALDSASEVMITEAIESLRGNLTIIAVAHRLSTILAADRIITLEAGRVVQAGPYEELLAQDGPFRLLYEAQIGPGPSSASRSSSVVDEGSASRS